MKRIIIQYNKEQSYILDIFLKLLKKAGLLISVKQSSKDIMEIKVVPKNKD